MSKLNTKKMVLFGAGKIGRSFIGQLFSLSGYEVVFVDIDRPLIEKLNRAGQYRVVIKTQKGDHELLIRPVRGIWLNDIDLVVEELANASLASLSVGQQGLPAALPILAQALVVRRNKFGHWPLDIIIAENMRNGDRFILKELTRLLPAEFPTDLIGLIETSIGKMVPIMTRKDIEADPLQVFAEPYNTLIVAREGFRNEIPDVQGLAPKQNIKAWVDRKLFIHNLGHATAAYLGFQKNPSWVYLEEALRDPVVYNQTRQTMIQAGAILAALYPDEFTEAQLLDHIDDLLNRFCNKALGDTIFRVGCDLYRKLSPEDRLVAPIQAALEHNLPYDLIYTALKAGIGFRAADENGEFLPADKLFFEEARQGIDHILQSVCRLSLQ